MSGAGDRRVPLDLNGLTKIADTLEFDCCCAVHQRSDETFSNLHELANTQTPATNGPSSGRSARSTIRASPDSSAQIITTPTIAPSALTRELRFPSLETSRNSSLPDSAHQPEVKLMSTRHLYRYRNRLILSGAVNIVLFLAVIELSLWAVTKCPCKDGPPHPSVFSKGGAETRNDDIMNNSASTWRGIQHIPLSGPAAVTKCSCKDGQPQPSASSKEGEVDESRKNGIMNSSVAEWRKIQPITVHSTAAVTKCSCKDGQPQPSASSKEGEVDESRKNGIMNSSVAEWRKIQPITVHSTAAAAVICLCKGGAETKDDIMNSSVPDWRDIQPISFPSPAGTEMVRSELQKAVPDRHSLNTTTGTVMVRSELQKAVSDKHSLNTTTAAVTVSYEHQNTTPDQPSLNTSTGKVTNTSENEKTVPDQPSLNTSTGRVTNTSENEKTVPDQPSLNASTVFPVDKRLESNFTQKEVFPVDKRLESNFTQKEVFPVDKRLISNFTQKEVFPVDKRLISNFTQKEVFPVDKRLESNFTQKEESERIDDYEDETENKDGA
ncbi:proteoglycan 4-like isoform X2 [Ambystoma mexicanum]|uniref:proteoglycan 4-like isoform X2 n=1 Tax=Ambystoma mexicanum TaxID=8296 RepID=UPI0037E94152